MAHKKIARPPPAACRIPTNPQAPALGSPLQAFRSARPMDHACDHFILADLPCLGADLPTPTSGGAGPTAHTIRQVVTESIRNLLRTIRDASRLHTSSSPTINNGGYPLPRDPVGGESD